MRSWIGSIVALARVVTIVQETSHGASGCSVIPPHLPEPGERERLAVAPVHEHRLLPLAPGPRCHS